MNTVLILDVDAPRNYIGAVLSQILIGEGAALSYLCRSLKKTERNYYAINKERLALVKSTHAYMVWVENL